MIDSILIFVLAVGLVLGACYVRAELLDACRFTSND
jgi:hypothetical protein